MYHKMIQVVILRLRPGALAQRLDNLVHHRRVVLSGRAVSPGSAG